MISLFRPAEPSGWQYREAWFDEAAGEFVVHHGAVGVNGTLTAEKAQPEEAQVLLESFTAQCAADGYREVSKEETTELVVAVPLKGSEPSAAERRNADTVHATVLTTLAWRGLGALSDPEPAEFDGATALVMSGRTLHRRKAGDAVRGAIRGTDVPASKVRIRIG
ncbi:hypothetical protein [Nesterenkonia sp. HG001]|uniref:hypothetical protein n=1 Tax=Nesterenkonia sp. HG001 TaxID=2983207 RepID=UPI002AC6851C|nr:hypothetical protein [Nesterenkonia sp. HG001]MDZ5078382.1 hypothetical protein [Nesterenkonia sp. HG001]